LSEELNHGAYASLPKLYSVERVSAVDICFGTNDLVVIIKLNLNDTIQAFQCKVVKNSAHFRSCKKHYFLSLAY
jgi:hypothetical protein